MNELNPIQQSFEELISLAIRKEEEAYDFYMTAARHAEHQSSVKLLEELAAQEMKHKEKLQNALNSGVCETFECRTSDEFERLDLSQYLVDIPLKPSSTSQDILIVAIKREEVAYKFYMALAGLTKMDSHRAVFETLAKEEQKHKERLESIYDEHISPWM